MSDDFEMNDSLDNLDLDSIRNYTRRNNLSGMQLSGWDDDTEDIEEEPDPHKNESTEILWAAENGDLELVKNIVERKKDVINTKDKDGYTALHRAAYNNHIDVAEYLLSNGADYTATTEDLWQPLHSACRWNSAEVAARLLEAGADINATSRGGQTPLHLAASNSDARETLELLLMNKNIRADIMNSTNETAYDIARRSGRHYPLFEITDPCLNQL